jgi:ABC-type glycerol-3-phosphate transport system substrate-binding protein
MSHSIDRTGLTVQRVLLVLALFLAGCGGAHPASADGELDCQTELTWTEQGSVPEGTTGLANPEAAVEAYLSPFMENHGGVIVIVDESRGSLVVDHVEVVVGLASEAPAGGWLVLTGLGCDGFDRP